MCLIFPFFFLSVFYEFYKKRHILQSLRCDMVLSCLIGIFISSEQFNGFIFWYEIPSHVPSHTHLLWDWMELFVAAFIFLSFSGWFEANSLIISVFSLRAQMNSLQKHTGAPQQLWSGKKKWRRVHSTLSVRKYRSSTADSLWLTKADS